MSARKISRSRMMNAFPFSDQRAALTPDCRYLEIKSQSQVESTASQSLKSNASRRVAGERDAVEENSQKQCENEQIDAVAVGLPPESGEAGIRHHGCQCEMQKEEKNWPHSTLAFATRPSGTRRRLTASPGDLQL